MYFLESTFCDPIIVQFLYIRISFVNMFDRTKGQIFKGHKYESQVGRKCYKSSRIPIWDREGLDNYTIVLITGKQGLI